MGWLALIGNAFKAFAIALGWGKQAADQQTGVKLEEGAVDHANLATVKAELDAATNAPKTEDDVLKRLDEGSA